METKDKIPFNSMDDHQIHDYVYRKVIEDFNILFCRKVNFSVSKFIDR